MWSWGGCERAPGRDESELAAANTRLAELDQLKTDFVSMVSHELRTPLGLIKGYTGTLLQADLTRRGHAALSFSRSSTRRPIASPSR